MLEQRQIQLYEIETLRRKIISNKTIIEHAIVYTTSMKLKNKELLQIN